MRVIRNVLGLLVFCLALFGTQERKITAFETWCDFQGWYEIDPPPQRYTEVCYDSNCDEAFTACNDQCRLDHNGWMVGLSCDMDDSTAIALCTCSYVHDGR